VPASESDPGKPFFPSPGLARGKLRQHTWNSWGGGDKVTIKDYQRKDRTYVKGYQGGKHK